MILKENLFLRFVLSGLEGTQIIFEKPAEIGMVIKSGRPLVVSSSPLLYGFVTGMDMEFCRVNFSEDFQRIWDFREIYKVKTQIPELITQEHCAHFQSLLPDWKYVRGVLLPK